MYRYHVCFRFEDSQGNTELGSARVKLPKRIRAHNADEMIEYIMYGIGTREGLAKLTILNYQYVGRIWPRWLQWLPW